MRYRKHAVIGGTQFIPIAGGITLAVQSDQSRVDTTRDETFVVCESSPVSAKWLRSPQFRWFCKEIGQQPEIVERRIDGHTVSAMVVCLPFGVRSHSELSASLVAIAARCNLNAEWSISNPGQGHLVWEGSGTTQHMLSSQTGKFRNTGSKPSRTRNCNSLPSREEIDRPESVYQGERQVVRGLEDDDSYGKRCRLASRFTDDD